MKIIRQEGFSLVEIMGVVAIVGILAAIAIPQYNAYRVKALNAAAMADANAGSALFRSYYADNNEYPAATAVSTGSISWGTVTWNLSHSVSAGTINGPLGAKMQYMLETKHIAGNICYWANDATTITMEINGGTAGAALNTGVLSYAAPACI